jgi:hypothetical protein
MLCWWLTTLEEKVSAGSQNSAVPKMCNDEQNHSQIWIANVLNFNVGDVGRRRQDCFAERFLDQTLWGEVRNEILCP